MWNLLERPARESSDPKLVDWVGEMVPGLEKNFLVGKETHLDRLNHLDHLVHLDHLDHLDHFDHTDHVWAKGL